MPIFVWLARFVGSTVALAFNLIAASAVFLLSAHLFALDDADARVPAYIARGIAAIWMFGATWHYLKHGVLQRPKATPQQGKPKPTGKEAALSSLGCFAILGAIIATALSLGPYADWVYGGLVGDDPAHPARMVLARVMDAANALAQDPSRFFGYYIAVAIGLVVLRLVSAWGSRTRTPSSLQQRRQERLRKHREKKDAATRRESKVADVARVPAGGLSRATSGPTSATRVSNSGRTIDDPLLGSLRRDDSIGGWRLANPRSDIGSLVIVNSDEPSEAQMEVGRSLVQRSFEALLRASDAARAAAQSNGIGLPRFTVAESIVGEADGEHPKVTMRLRCEGDASRVYEVTSTDGMQTFRG
jgi:hypothetical protein